MKGGWTKGNLEMLINTMNLIEANKRAKATDMEQFLEPLIIEDSFMQMIPWEAGNGRKHHTRVKASGVDINAKFVGAGEGLPTSSAAATSEELNYIKYGTASEIPMDIVDESDDPAKTRATESAMLVKGLLNKYTSLIFSNDGAEAGSFRGLNSLRSKLGLTSTYHNIEWNLVFNAGGTGSKLTSVWLAQFGDDKLCMRYQPGKTVGITHKDAGIHDAFDGNKNRIQVYRDEYTIFGAPDLEEETALIRCANVDWSKTSGTGAFTELLASDMLSCLPDQNWNNTAFFVHPYVLSNLRTYFSAKENVRYSYEEIQRLGKVLTVWGVPILPQGTFSVAESALTA